MVGGADDHVGQGEFIGLLPGDGSPFGGAVRFGQGWGGVVALGPRHHGWSHHAQVSPGQPVGDPASEALVAGACDHGDVAAQALDFGPDFAQPRCQSGLGPDVKGENLGWKGHNLKVIVYVWREKGREKLTWDGLALEPLAPFEFEAIIPNPGGAPVPMDASLDWGGGREHIPVWPEERESRWFERSPFRSVGVVLLAVVVVWVGVPMLWRMVFPAREQ